MTTGTTVQASSTLAGWLHLPAGHHRQCLPRRAGPAEGGGGAGREVRQRGGGGGGRDQAGDHQLPGGAGGGGRSQVVAPPQKHSPNLARLAR